MRLDGSFVSLPVSQPRRQFQTAQRFRGRHERANALEGDFHPPRKITLYGEITDPDAGGYGYLVVRFDGRAPIRVEAKYLLPAGFKGKQSQQRDGLDGEEPTANSFA